MDIYKINDDNSLRKVEQKNVDTEKKLEDILEKNIHIIDSTFKIIGRQVSISNSGRIDILAIDGNGKLIILELKKGRGNRDIIAQILDYASYIEDLSRKDLEEIIKKQNKHPKDFEEELENFNAYKDDINHKLYIITLGKEDGLGRIIDYLTKRGTLINSIYYKYIEEDNYLIIDKEISEEEQEERFYESRSQLPTGYKYVNIRHQDIDNWNDYQKYGFICAGGGNRYSNPLINNLEIGDKILAYKKGFGYLGYGIVEENAIKGKAFRINNKSLDDLEVKTQYLNEEDEELMDYCVKVKWIKTLNENQAIKEKGLFANQNIVCNIYDNERGLFTIKTLKNKGLIPNNQ